MWQEIIVGMCVIAAIIFLARRWIPFFAKKIPGCATACGGCGGASSCHNPSEKV